MCFTTKVSASVNLHHPAPAGLHLPTGATAAGAGALLQLMRDGQPRTRAELIQLTGLARSTVGARVESLLAAGLLVPAGESRSTGGRPPTRLAFNPEAGFVIGADLGATHATRGIGNFAGIAIGLTLTFIHLASIPIDNTSVNPARSIATAIYGGPEYLGQLWVFILFPLVGGLLAGFLHRALFEPTPPPPARAEARTK